MKGLDGATPAVLLIIIATIGPVMWGIHKARKGHSLFVRRIPGIDAVDEACGRCAELGKPAVFTSGLTSLGPILYACLGVLHYIAYKAARLKLKLLLPQNQPDVLAVSEEVARDAYRSAGRSSLFDTKNLVYLSDEQFAFAAGYIGIAQREQIGSAFLFGSFAAESLVLAEAGQQVGAMQVAASVSPEQVAFFVAACDYTLIGEELFGAAAYLTKEPIQLGSLYGQDRAKLFILIIMITGVLMATISSVFPGITSVSMEDLLYFKWSDFI